MKDLKTSICGCSENQNRRRMRVDLTGRRVGRLVALYPTEKRDQRGCIVWHCRCDCGNEMDVSQSELIYGNYRSCGCKKQEAKDHIQDYLTFVDGTCVE